MGAFLSSSTVAASNRTVSAAPEGRLMEVAEHHGGRIPLHGRLFAQWMHQAYPRECPYPHVAGTTKPQRAIEYRKETGLSHKASKEDMQQLAAQRPERAPGQDDEAEEYGMWTMEEDLIARHELPAARPRSEATRALRSFFSMAACLSMAFALFRTLSSALRGARGDVLPTVNQSKRKSYRYSV